MDERSESRAAATAGSEGRDETVSSGDGQSGEVAERGPISATGPSSAEATAGDDTPYAALQFQTARDEGVRAGASGAASVQKSGQTDLAAGDADVAVSAMTCLACSAAISSGQYYTFNHQPACSSCASNLRERLRTEGSFGRAASFGLLAAVGGAALYYGISALTGYEFGLIAIVVGIAVGKAVRHGAAQRAQWTYRGLALLLTWTSIVATYVPDIVSVVEGDGVGRWVLAGALAMVGPFFLLAEGEFMSVIILAIGLWEAWRYAAAATIAVEGPFSVGAQREPSEVSELEVRRADG